MGSAICRRLKREGHYIIASNWTKNQHMAENEFCDEYHVVDPTVMDNCLEITRGVDFVFHLATATVGVGFSESNPSVTKENNTIIGYNMIEAARINGVQRLFYASIAHIYPELKQVETNVSLEASVAGLAERQYPTGFENPETEGLLQRYGKKFKLEGRIGRFYCIYGPSETWEGGVGKARAAICREPNTSAGKFGMLGDGRHPRYVEAVLRLMESDCREPVYIGCLDWRELVNVGKDEIVGENEAVEMVPRFEDEELPPIEEELGCAGLLQGWLRIMCFWSKDQREKV